MRGCDHDKVYSGRTNLDRRFQWICATCGEIGWSEHYELSAVDHERFCELRVAHGWAVDTWPPVALRGLARPRDDGRARTTAAFGAAAMGYIALTTADPWLQLASSAVGVALTALWLTHLWRRYG